MCFGTVRKVALPDVPCVVAQLILANPGPAVIDKLHASGSAQLIGEDKIFLTVADAVASCCPKSVGEV
jgi:high affinity sulfate transporter 1